MAKKKFNCNHCGREYEWYENWMHETDLIKIDEKWYCEECRCKIAHVAIDS